MGADFHNLPPDEAAEFAASIVDTMRDPLLVLDADLRVVGASGEFYRVFQVTPEVTIGQLIYDLGNRQWEIPALRRLLEEVLPQHTTFRDFEVEHTFERIGRRVMLLNARRLVRAAGRPPLILLVIEDATVRRDAEQARRVAETRFTEMVKNVRDHSIFLTDPDGIITSWNVAAERIIGYSESEALGQHFSMIFPPEDVAAGVPQHELRQALQFGRAEDERWHRRKTGELFWALGIVSPLHDAEGRLTGYCKILRDMTDRKRAEAELRRSEEHLQQVIEQLPVSVGLFGQDGSLVIANALMRQVLPALIPSRDPARRGQWVGHDAEGRLIPPEEWPGARALRGEHVSPGINFCHTPEDGGPETWFLVSTAPFRDASGNVTGAVAIMQDVTKLRRAEDALRESEERLRLALRAARMGTWTWDIPNNCHRRDANLNAMLGLPAVEAEEAFPRFLEHIHPDDRSTVSEEFHRCVKHGHNLNIEFRTLWPNGAIRWLRDQGDVFGEGDHRYMTGACLDITERKELEHALLEADRRKDQFLATLAHELRNPLAPIRSGIELMKLVPENSEAMIKIRDTMERQTDQLVRLIDDLMDVSRITRGKLQLKLQSVRLDEVVRNAVEATQTSMEEAGHTLSVSMPEEPLAIQADPHRLAQVLANLLQNAAKYSPTPGRISLSAQQEGSGVTFAVSDNGIGIPAEKHADIFEMFSQVDVTTQAGRKGLGIGLTLVKSLVEMHGGSVEVKSPGVNQGSTFTVRLPDCVRELVPDVPAVPPDVIRSSRRVLIVDDNKDAAQVLSMMVKALGNETEVAYDGMEALERAAEFLPDVVIMDVGMPKMDGCEAARRMRQTSWGRQIVLVALTGWGQEGDRERTREAGFDEHLVKPADPATLQALLVSCKPLQTPSSEP